MPLNPALLQVDIKKAFKSAGSSYEAGDSESYLNTLSLELAKAIVTHITANAQVTTTVTGTSPAGPITGNGIGKIL